MKHAAALLTLLLAAAPAHAVDAPIKPGKIRLGIDSLPLSFGNPYRTAQIPSIYVLSALYDGLTRIGVDGTLRPWLATSWESDDAVTWRFKLRDDVVFADGTPLTADAYKVAVDYLASDEALREGLVREIPKLKAARVVDPRTIEITLAEPDALFPRSAAALPVAEPKAWTTLGREAFSKTPVGTGPYKIVRFESNKIVLTANDKSWRKPKVRDLEIVAIPDVSSRTQALLANQIDIALGLGPEAMSDITSEGGQVSATPTAQVYVWSFMLQREGKKVDTPLQDARVRRAMTMAVNRQQIVDTILGGYGKVASQGATPIVYGYNPDLKPLPYDPGAAKKLLAEAGYPNGFSMTMLATASAVGAQTQVHQRVASDLAAVGIQVEIRTAPVPQYLNYLSRATFPTDAFGVTFPADPNIDAIRPLRIHSCLRREAFYCDERIMPKIKEALAARDPATALRLRREIVAWYHDEAPSIFISEDMRLAGLGASVRGYEDAHGMIAYDAIDIVK
ncbi:MAG: ABC transporter substrate-binding protein [Rhodospirillaceae bacterium]|nr:ABC transporter substrate-binding protein [Rhodospirillaceae bacterium]